MCEGDTESVCVCLCVCVPVDLRPDRVTYKNAMVGTEVVCACACACACECV